MIPPDVRAVADAVLYEGYVLYPYRPSSVKNRQRWCFGGLHPRAYCDASGNVEPFAQLTDVLVEAAAGATVEARVRFLHLVRRVFVPHDGAPFAPWDEAEEREVAVGPVPLDALADAPHVAWVTCDGLERREAVPGGQVERVRRPVTCAVELAAERLSARLVRLSILVRNESAFDVGAAGQRDASVPYLLASTHSVCKVTGGAFVSQQDPPAGLAGPAAACRCRGAWPVLAGERGRRDLMLVAPIILYDHPRVAGESPGDLFDATEIDEILTLRIRTLTPDERAEAAATDPKLAALIARCDALGPADLARLHGRLERAEPPRATAQIGGAHVSPGARVRMRPTGRADMMDLALDGRLATISGIEEDAEGQVWVTVTVDDDPGRDLGVRGEPGHRFFFRPGELELVEVP